LWVSLALAGRAAGADISGRAFATGVGGVLHFDFRPASGKEEAEEKGEYLHDLAPFWDLRKLA
jgi:hypothetical protein